MFSSRPDNNSLGIETSEKIVKLKGGLKKSQLKIIFTINELYLTKFI